MEFTYDPPAELTRYPTMGGGDGYDPNAFDQPAWPTGDRVERADADYVVRSAAELADAADRAGSGEVIWIPGGEHLDVTDISHLDPADGAVVASDRGVDGSEGALLEATQSFNFLFKLRNDGVRISGIQFLFPITENLDYGDYDTGTGIGVDANDVEVDNCVFRGFSHAGVEVGRHGAVQGTHVHHNSFVDNPAGGLGYGVVVFHGEPLVQANYFDHNRHGIAADGAPDCAYRLYSNFFGPRTTMHTIDMHDGDDGHGGRRVHIVQNVVMATHYVDGNPATGVYIRGPPHEESHVAHNQFAHPAKPDGTGEWGDAYAINADSIASSNTIFTGNHYDQTSPAPVPEH